LTEDEGRIERLNRIRFEGSGEVTIDPSEVVHPDSTEAGFSTISDSFEREAGLESLPNDLTRLLYLASLRDCNSGRYLHPQLSLSIGVEEAHRRIGKCHGRIFRGLLTTPISQYVLQLEQYIRYTRTDRGTVLRTWQSLEAYRATVPVPALPIYRDLFVLNVEIALAILNSAVDSGAQPQELDAAGS
jgi:hypothetical protein